MGVHAFLRVSVSVSLFFVGLFAQCSTESDSLFNTGVNCS